MAEQKTQIEKEIENRLADERKKIIEKKPKKNKYSVFQRILTWLLVITVSGGLIYTLIRIFSIKGVGF
jgi:hypothetical protein